jgi:predicted enzyme related to lactoylglutathione lyase
VSESKIGTIGWHDLTVPNAGAVKDFYVAVLGASVQETSMGDYSDYTLINPQGEAIGGVCHATGKNTGIPPQWLMYVSVKDIDESLRQVTAKGGNIVKPKWSMGDYGAFAIIQDPAGASMALHQSK